MKVLHVVPSLALSQGGISASVRELCLGLVRIGVETQIFTTSRGYIPAIDGPADELLKATGAEVRYFPIPPLGRFGRRYAYSPALGASLREAIPQVDLVHIHSLWLYPTFKAARVCQSVHVPYLISPCGMLDPFSLRIRGIRKRIYGLLFERETLRGAAAIHFTSVMEQRYAWTLGIHRPSIVIPCSIQVEATREVPSGMFRSRHPEIGQRRILLFLGRLHPKKRPDLVAKAFALLARRLDDVHLVIAGPEEGAGRQAHTILKQAGLLNRVTFTGFLSGMDKWAALRDSSLFLLPSEDENFGMSALEAMAAGVPVFLSAHVGLADWVRKAQAGLVLDQDPKAWSDAIEDLLAHPEVAPAMGEAGRWLVKQEFSSTQIATRMRDAYAEILQQDPRSK